MIFCPVGTGVCPVDWVLGSDWTTVSVGFGTEVRAEREKVVCAHIQDKSSTKDQTVLLSGNI